MGAYDLGDRRGRGAGHGADARELAALLEPYSQHEAEEAERSADKEADAPAPSLDLLDGQRLVHGEVQQRGEEHARVDAEEYDADRKPGPMRRRLDDVRDRARQLAAQAEALHDAQQHEQDR